MYKILGQQILRVLQYNID